MDYLITALVSAFLAAWAMHAYDMFRYGRALSELDELTKELEAAKHELLVETRNLIDAKNQHLTGFKPISTRKTRKAQQ